MRLIVLFYVPRQRIVTLNYITFLFCMIMKFAIILREQHTMLSVGTCCYTMSWYQVAQWGELKWMHFIDGQDRLLGPFSGTEGHEGGHEADY
jgi:hypothetical protein